MIGQHSHLVPKEPAANIAYRRWLLRTCRESPKFRRAVIQMCREDILFWIDAFVWQFNPNAFGRASQEVGPFICWDFQEEFCREVLECIEERKDVVVDKSREMGASWLCLLIMTWLMLFHANKKFLCVSKDEDSVDKPGEPDSLFWKIDYILSHLPDWLKPKVRRTKRRFSVKAHNSYITGVASVGGKIGVGGRATAIFVDEFSLIKEDRALLSHTANTTGCRIFNGTHRGTGTALFDLVDPTNAASSFIRKIRMHWTRHPDKAKGCYHWDAVKQEIVVHDPDFVYPVNYEFDKTGKPTGGPCPGIRSPWYDDMCRRIGDPRAIAMDLDIDPQGSIEKLFPPELIRDLVARYAQRPTWEGDLIRREDDTLLFSSRRGGPLQLWLELDRDGKPPPDTYAFGADISHGQGSTPSCGSGINARTGMKVFSYVNPHIEPTPFGYLMVAVCKHFCNEDGAGAWLIWEIQGPGVTFGKRVIESGYRRVFYRRDESKLKSTISDTPGWNSKADNKNSLLVEYRDGLRGGPFGRLHNPDERALNNTLNFNFEKTGNIVHSREKNPKDLSGARVNHGDITIADALAWKMCLQLKRLSTPKAPSRGEIIHPKTLAWRHLLSQNGKTLRPWAS